MVKSYYVYIISNKNHTVFYTGVTNNLIRRIYEHKEKLIDGFTKKYNIGKLLFFEEYNDVEVAISREKQIKDYRREKKLALIKEQNLNWRDLWEDINK
ncbi:MAG: GIY-YIG nuclease family protein [Candidatus Spechtbacteria bacterium]|nr:GIY-YIG nuclease family protein [Candidatus Spechtbacteria bacterium]